MQRCLGVYEQPAALALPEVLGHIDQQIERMRLIVTQLLQFARPNEFAGYVDNVDTAQALQIKAAVVQGKAIKADDNRVAAIASWIHRELDQGSRLTEAQRKALWWRAHVATVRLLLATKQWPARVPIPDIDNCPFGPEPLP